MRSRVHEYGGGAYWRHGDTVWCSNFADGRAVPPPVLPHRGPTPRLPQWLRRFATRGWLSYVRLGLEVLRAPDLRWLVRRVVRWLGHYLWTTTPLWRPWQRRYRQLHWWPDAP